MTEEGQPGGALSDAWCVFRTYWPLLLGNVLEWYEFGVYGAMDLQIKENFFKGSAAATWITFAFGFLGRPLGGAVLGLVGDLFGRRFATNMSIIGMLIGTVCQGLLPARSSTGVALLIVLRLIQGMSAGGEIAAVSVYVCEVAPQRSMGRSISFIAMTANAGGIIALCTVDLLTVLIGDENMMQWGWRIPFLLSIFPGSMAVWGRRGMPESQVFLQQGLPTAGCQTDIERSANDSGSCESTKEDGSPSANQPDAKGRFRSVLWSHFPAMLIATSGVAASALQAYLAGVWITSYLREHGLTPGESMTVTIIGRTITLILAPLVGWLADVKCIGFVMMAGACTLTVVGFPLFFAVHANPTSYVVAILAFGAANGVVACLVSTELYAFVAELFPTAVRAVGCGISYNVGVSVFGGLVPFIAESSLSVSQYGPGILLSAAGALTAGMLIVGMRLQSQGKMQMAHIRPAPYFG